jgi:putative FmdB family regulatory protein
MPLYEYECGACGERFEVIQKFSDGPVEVCRKCGKGPVQRLVSSPAIQFKGSGWYITDYAQKGKTSDPGSSKPAKSESAAGESGTKSDTTKTTESTTASPKATTKD